MKVLLTLQRNEQVLYRYLMQSCHSKLDSQDHSYFTNWRSSPEWLGTWTTRSQGSCPLQGPRIALCDAGEATELRGEWPGVLFSREASLLPRSLGKPFSSR